MRILAACEDSGSLKEIVCIQGTDTSVQTATQPEKIETYAELGLRSHIQKFIVTSTPEGQVIVAARANGHISIYKTETYDLINTVTDGHVTEGDDKDRFISVIESFGLIYCCSEKGKVTIINPKTIHSKTVVTTSTTLRAPISAFVAHPEQEGVFAYGGKENDVKIVRLYTPPSTPFAELKPTQLFQGKNVKNDRLDLRVPIWITNILFVRLAQHTDSTWQFITTTRYGQVRRYDTSHGRKPVLDKKLSEKPLVQVVTTKDEEEIICADTHNVTALYHIEKGNLVAKYKGSVGAVQGLYSDIESGLLVTGALDRYVRVFGIDSREQVAKVFVGAKVSCVWLLDNTLGEKPVDEDSKEQKKKKKVRKAVVEAQREEPDAVWEQLNKLETGVKKRKTK